MVGVTADYVAAWRKSTWDAFESPMISSVDGMRLVLIHGLYFGRWCWDLITPELERLGHWVTAVDLPISERGLGAPNYADAVLAGSDWSDPPVPVAHSMAGLVAPIFAARREVRRIIFIASFLASRTGVPHRSADVRLRRTPQPNPSADRPESRPARGRPIMPSNRACTHPTG